MAITLFFLVVAVAAFISGPRDTEAALRDPQCSNGHDVVLRVGDEEFRAHKAVLGLYSEVFRNMFDMNPDIERITVNLKHISTTSVNNFLEYLYTGELPEYYGQDKTYVTVDLLKLARRFKVTDIEEICAKRSAYMHYKDALEMLLVGFKNPEVSKKVLGVATSVILNYPIEYLREEGLWCNFESKLPDVARMFRIAENYGANRNADDTSSLDDEIPCVDFQIIESEEEGDIVFRVGDDEVRAHKAALERSSEVFRDMFSNEPEKKEVYVENISTKASVEAFLAYLHYGVLPKYYGHDLGYFIADVLRLAELYKVTAIKEICLRHVASMPYEDALKVLSVGYKQADVCEEVLSQATSIVVEYLDEKLSNEEAWSNFKLELPDVAEVITVFKSYLIG